MIRTNDKNMLRVLERTNDKDMEKPMRVHANISFTRVHALLMRLANTGNKQ